MLEPVELPCLCQGKQSPVRGQEQGSETRIQLTGFGQSCTDCTTAPGRPLLNAPHAKQISKNWCDPWGLCMSLASIIQHQVSSCACAIPRGAGKTSLFRSGDISRGWWYIIQQRGRSRPLCISCLINRTRIKNLPIKLDNSTRNLLPWSL